MQYEYPRAIALLDYGSAKLIVREFKDRDGLQADEAAEEVAAAEGVRLSDCEWMLAAPLHVDMPTSPQTYANVQNMQSSGGREVANQFLITTRDGVYFQSYRSTIAFRPNDGGQVVLDAHYWDYSTTTGKYRNQFLGEDIEETRRKIKDGTYKLANLN